MSKEETAKKKNWFVRHKVWTVVIVVVVLGSLGAATSNEKDNAGSPTDVSYRSTSDVATTSPTPTPEAQEPSVPPEYTSALNKATSYANRQDMSKQRVYDQLTSEYGENFSPEAAQYAIDNVKADWNANALAKAKSYQSRQSMSPARIYDQLTSTYGEQFTTAEADYAIAHLND